MVNEFKLKIQFAQFIFIFKRLFLVRVVLQNIFCQAWGRTLQLKKLEETSINIK